MGRALATLTLALAAALAGCGGEDKLSVDEYRAQLRTICKDAERRSEGVRQPTRATPEAIADYLTRLRDVNARTIERVERLEPPDELKGAHDRALEANRDGREKVDQVIDELKAGGEPAKVLSDARDELQESSAAAKRATRDVGVPECAS
ncbi:MAG TPA: hypothetical protein VGW75_02315 [Solirubrobacteraceae bacterium]|jgi:hypothetical protein|nr:hypothetical protein [Solirubrobacteraceae bacterium]